MTTTAVPLPQFVAPSAPAYTAEMLDDLGDCREWQLLEDVLPDLVRAWRAAEIGDIGQADSLLGSLVAILRARRDAIEKTTARA